MALQDTGEAEQLPQRGPLARDHRITAVQSAQWPAIDEPGQRIHLDHFPETSTRHELAKGLSRLGHVARASRSAVLAVLLPGTCCCGGLPQAAGG